MFAFFLGSDAGNFSIYVTNKTTGENEIFVRLRDDRLPESVTNPRILSETSVGMSGDGEVGQGRGKLKAGINVAHKETVDTREHEVNKCLTQAGYSFLPQGEVRPFAVGNSDSLMYFSVHDGSRSWCWNMPVNPQQYGCITIKEDRNGHISIIPSNPEPHWIQINENQPTFPSDAVRVHRRSNNTVVYLAKVTAVSKIRHGLFVIEPSQNEKYLTGVLRENGIFSRGYKSSILQSIENLEFNEDLLLARKYEWVKAQNGNKIPPNAVKTALLIKGRNEELYVGRVGGERICEVSHLNGVIRYFTDNSGSWSYSGEILLLTLDPSV